MGLKIKLSINDITPLLRGAPLLGARRLRLQHPIQGAQCVLGELPSKSPQLSPELGARRLRLQHPIQDLAHVEVYGGMGNS